MIPCGYGTVEFNEWEYQLWLKAQPVETKWKWQCVGEFCKIFPCDKLTGEQIMMAPKREMKLDTRIRSAITPIEVFGGDS